MVDIIQAIVDGDLAAVKTALSQGSDPNTLGRDGLRAVHYSGMYNQPAIYAELVKAHANVNAKDPHNHNVSYYAARAGASADFIVQIFKSGVDLNNQSEIGQTAMHVAARLGKVEAIQGLLKCGANPNIKDFVGKTPLLDAVKTNHPEDILLLKSFGANSTIKDNYGVTALSAGLSSTNPLIKDIFELAILDKLQVPANNALITAAVVHDIPGMQTALASGVPVNTGNQFGITALHHAALNGFSDEITVLKKAGASIIQTDGNGTQAIHFAAMTHQSGAVDTLLGMGATISAQDKLGNTPLHYAAQFTDEPAFIQKLLDAGANINAVNHAGETPLHLAAADGNLETVKFLVAHHANVAAIDAQGETPLQEAVKAKYTDVATFLSTQKAAAFAAMSEQSTDLPTLEKLEIPAGNALFVATAHHDLEGMQAALDHGNNVDTTNHFGVTPLHYASYNGFNDAISLLLDNGASLMRTDYYDGVQAMHFAAMTHQSETIDLLLSKGAAINATDKLGNTPLHYAAEFTNEPVFIQKLLDAGAWIDNPNNSGETALHLAAADGNLEVVKVLIANHADATALDKQGETALQEAIKTHHADVVTFLSEQNAVASDGHALIQALKPAEVQSQLSLSDVLSADHAVKGLEGNGHHTAITQASESAPAQSIYTQIDQTVVHVDAIL